MRISPAAHPAAELKPPPLRRARQPCQRRGLRVTLGINHHRKVFPAEPAKKLRANGTHRHEVSSLENPPVQRDYLINLRKRRRDRFVFHQRKVGDFGIRKVRAKHGERRQSEHHIAHGFPFDEENVHCQSRPYSAAAAPVAQFKSGQTWIDVRRGSGRIGCHWIVQRQEFDRPGRDCLSSADAGQSRTAVR